MKGQFIEINFKSLHKNIILGNVYRPPRNNTNNYRTFIDEITPLLTYLESCNSEVVIAEDYNINLLKVNEIELFSEFFDAYLHVVSTPKIPYLQGFLTLKVH